MDIFNHYYGTILVWCHNPFETTDTDGLKQIVKGYYLNVGVSAISETQARDLIAHAVEDGEIDWNDSEFQEAEWASLHPLIRESFESSEKDGIWYKSGRVFFPDDKD